MFPDVPVSPWEIAMVCSFIVPYSCLMLFMYWPWRSDDKNYRRY